MVLMMFANIIKNPGEDQLIHCFSTVYNSKLDGHGVPEIVPHFPEICRNSYYKVWKPFPYARAHRHFIKFTDLISAHKSSV